jgi:two-component system chemotaxis response regulator CheB
MLQADSRMPVTLAYDGQAIEKSTIYIAPPDRHMLVHDEAIVLSRGPKENSPVRPLIRYFDR